MKDQNLKKWGIMGIIIASAITFLIFIWFVITFNSFISKKNAIKEAWSGIDVQLKRRHDVIPNLVQTVKGYAQHEMDLLEKVTALRSNCLNSKDSAERFESENALTQGLSRLLVVTEKYPDLKANQNFTALQNTLSDIEEQIQMARRYYNGSVKLYNIQIESFPSMIVANSMRLKPFGYFEILSPEEKEVPVVNF